MPRYVWAVGGLMWWSACPGGKDPEQRNEEMRACILQHLPPMEDTATEWKVSGYVLVDAYTKCHEKAEEATAADFRAVVQEIARMEEGTALVRMTPSGGTR